MDDADLTLVILGAVIVLFVWNRLSVGVVAILTMLALWATGLLPVDAVLAGFGDPVVVFIATLFVVSEGIDSTGVTTWLGQLIVAKAGESRARLVLAVGLLCAVLTALITLNGSVAALLPLVVVLAMRIGQPPSQMLMPLAFAGSCGALFMLTGSPVNVIVSEAAAGQRRPSVRLLLVRGRRDPAAGRDVGHLRPARPSAATASTTGPPGRGPRASRRDPRAVLLAHRRVLPAPAARPLPARRAGHGRGRAVRIPRRGAGGGPGPGTPAGDGAPSWPSTTCSS